MRLRTERNYEAQKRLALDFGRNPPFPTPIAKQMGVNAEGRFDKVLFGTCDTCDLYFAENITPLPTDADGLSQPCDIGECDGTVTQIHLEVGN